MGTSWLVAVFSVFEVPNSLILSFSSINLSDLRSPKVGEMMKFTQGFVNKKKKHRRVLTPPF